MAESQQSLTFNVKRERSYAESSKHSWQEASTDMMVQRIWNLADAMLDACDEIERLTSNQDSEPKEDA